MWGGTDKAWECAAPAYLGITARDPVELQLECERIDRLGELDDHGHVGRIIF